MIVRRAGGFRPAQSSEGLFMKEIDYLAPSSLGEAYAALQNGKTSAFLAGGTDIIVQLREGRKQVDQLIDVKHIPELMSYAWTGDGGLEIGASVPFAEIYEDDEIVRRLPCVIDCATLVGGIQIQSRACFGGNIGNSGPAADTVPRAHSARRHAHAWLRRRHARPAPRGLLHRPRPERPRAR